MSQIQPQKNSEYINSILRSIQIMELFSKTGQEYLGLAEISSSLNLHKTTTFRILKTLLHAGWLVQPHENGKYKLGFNILRVAAGVANDYDLKSLISCEMQLLCEQFNENVILGALINGNGACLDIIKAQHNLSLVTGAGYHVPLNHGATGKVIFAYQSQDFIDNFLAAHCSDYTDVQKKSLIGELEAIRENGICLSESEVDMGVTAIAVPILDSSQNFLYSLSISGATGRLKALGYENLKKGLQKALANIYQNINLLFEYKH